MEVSRALLACMLRLRCSGVSLSILIESKDTRYFPIPVEPSRKKKGNLRFFAKAPPVAAGPVSRVLSPCPKARLSVIYLRRRSPAASSNLPPGIGRATLSLPVYTVLQPAGRTAADIAARAVGSYPAFSPLPRAVGPCRTKAPAEVRGGRFLLRCHKLSPIKSLACAVLCVARTFLP